MKIEFSIRDKFNLDCPADLVVDGYIEHSPEVPKEDADYIFNRDILRDLINWWSNGGKDGIYLFGPHGCGKSSAIYQFAARLNIPVYDKVIYRKMRFEELLGQDRLLGGDTVFTYGPLAKAMGAEGNPGILLLNEVDRADEGILTGLNEVLEGHAIDLYGRERVPPRDGFRVAATGNSGMLGDGTGLYRGTKHQDLSFVDRFWQIKCQYPAPEVEREILKKAFPLLPTAIGENMIQLANDIRHVFMGESVDADAIEVTVTTRGLLRWANLVMLYHKGAEAQGIDSILYSLERAVTNVASPETREAIKKAYNAVFGEMRHV